MGVWGKVVSSVSNASSLPGVKLPIKTSTMVFADGGSGSSSSPEPPIERQPDRSIFSTLTIADWIKVGTMIFGIIVWSAQVRSDVARLTEELEEARTTIAELRLEIQLIKVEQAKSNTALEFLVEREKQKQQSSYYKGDGGVR